MLYTDQEAVREIGGYLIHVRQIPNYYFRRQLRAMGTEETIVARSEPCRWVTNQGRVRLPDNTSEPTAAALFRRIHDQTKHHPPGETHAQARVRLKDELDRLQNEGITAAAAAGQLNVTTKVLQKMAAFQGKDDGYTTQCPWNTLDRIAASDWPAMLVEQQIPGESVVAHGITEGEIQRQRYRDMEAARIRATTETRYIEEGGSCWNCGAIWASMIPDKGPGRFAPVEMRCRICSRTALLRRAPDREEP